MPLMLASEHVDPITVRWCISGVLFVLGACVGSFLNVVVYRLPVKLSLVTPASRCPKCETPIRVFHNIPIVGWFILRGRCRDCSVRIPLRYPMVELITAIGFASIGWCNGGLSSHGLSRDQGDLTGALTRVASDNGWAMLVGVIAASCLIVAVCWIIDRVTVPISFHVIVAVTAVGAIIAATDPWRILAAVIYGGIGGLLFGIAYGMVRRKSGEFGIWPKTLIIGILAVVVASCCI